MATRLSKQQRMILMILRDRGERSTSFLVLRDRVLGANGLCWSTNSSRASLSRTLRLMCRKELIRLVYYRWSLGSAWQLVTRSARLTPFGLWTVERLKKESNSP